MPEASPDRDPLPRPQKLLPRIIASKLLPHCHPFGSQSLSESSGFLFYNSHTADCDNLPMICCKLLLLITHQH